MVTVGNRRGSNDAPSLQTQALQERAMAEGDKMLQEHLLSALPNTKLEKF